MFGTLIIHKCVNSKKNNKCIEKRIYSAETQKIKSWSTASGSAKFNKTEHEIMKNKVGGQVLRRIYGRIGSEETWRRRNNEKILNMLVETVKA